jgi:hypothetical protein
MTLDEIANQNIKLVINGGALNPKGLAIKTMDLIQQKNLSLKVAYVSGDDVLPRCEELLNKYHMEHLDSDNPHVKLAENSTNFLGVPHKNLLSANVYLGARAIVKGLDEGADIIICGRVADASPVIGLVQWWHGWSEHDYDYLAGALIAGHLIECSAYVTGSNFCGFDRFPLDDFIDIGFGIAEVESDGSCIITKHDMLKGLVNEDTVRCQFLYELQGATYLNSDVSANVQSVQIMQVGHNR